MKTKLPLIVALAAAIGSAGAIAQDQPTPPGGATPPPSPAPSTPQEANRPPQPPPPPPPSPGERRRDRGPQDQGEQHPGMPGGPGFRGPRERRGMPSQPQPFLGVMTAPVPPALATQLGLQEGFGVLVQDVLPDSPAAKAGVQKFDVLKLLNDQQLTDPNQLATLIRAAGKDAQVSLTVIRKGQEQKLSVTIAERAMPQRRGGEGPFGDVPMLDPRGGPEEMQRFHDEMRRFHDRVRDWHEHQGGPKPEDRRRERDGVPSADILKEARPGGGAQISVFSSDGLTKLDGSKARLILKDSDGEIEVSAENGKRTLTAKNPKGEIVFSGPVNTEEERKAVPEQFRQKLDKIQVRQQIDSQSASASASGSSKESGDASAEANVQ